jgi:type II secretory pathway pseudopilin PulG
MEMGTKRNEEQRQRAKRVQAAARQRAFRERRRVTQNCLQLTDKAQVTDAIFRSLALPPLTAATVQQKAQPRRNPDPEERSMTAMFNSTGDQTELVADGFRTPTLEVAKITCFEN